ncbi:MAG TPA: TetR/AcrR family transcriptional regulator [Thermopolyspora sp.]
MRSRRRGAVLEDALLDAAWEEVRAVGYADLTMEGAAARARTSKAVLYRRWPNRAVLVLSAMRRHVVSLVSEIPDSGDLREDVLIVMRQFRQRYEAVGPDITHGLLTELRDIPDDAFEVVPGVMTTVLAHAAERGEICLDKVTPRIIALPVDLLRHALMLSRTPVSEEFMAEIVDEVFLPLVRLTVAGHGPERRAASGRTDTA